MSFAELGLAEPILRAIQTAGYDTATPIQSQAIPAIIAGRDLLGCAQTGTGKTGAFALPLLHRLDELNREMGVQRPSDRVPRALVLCPTRELALQITQSLASYGRNLRLRNLAIFGGVNQHNQVRGLRAGVDILIATPGRLLDLMNQGYIDLSAIEILVLDEADRMLDMGFINDIRRITSEVPEDRQTLLFSATMPRAIEQLAASQLRDPIRVEVTPVASTVDTIAQSVYHIPKPAKAALLRELLATEPIGRTLVFARTKHGADRIVTNLRDAGVSADAIHGNKSQNARTRALNGFKTGRTQVLVATDIASRGIDVDGITHVINFDLPPDAETYVHRIGRTARAGRSGIAISFCDETERSSLRDIERVTNKKLHRANDGEQRFTESRAAPRPGHNPQKPRSRKPSGHSQGNAAQGGSKPRPKAKGQASSPQGAHPGATPPNKRRRRRSPGQHMARG